MGRRRALAGGRGSLLLSRRHQQLTEVIMTNKLRMNRLVFAILTTLACGTVWAHDGKHCSPSTLSGNYVFSATGYGMPAGVWAPKAIVEVIHFNGDGTLVVPAATVANRAGDGQVVASPPNGTGTYTVIDNCTGTLNFTNGRASISRSILRATMCG